MEFNDDLFEDSFLKYLELIIETFDLRDPKLYGTKYHLDFYLGLTDIEKEDVWKWSSSGRIFNMTLHQGKWEKDEPNGHKKEDCSYLKINSKQLYEWAEGLAFADQKFPKIHDITCDEKLTIICMRKAFV